MAFCIYICTLDYASGVSRLSGLLGHASEKTKSKKSHSDNPYLLLIVGLLNSITVTFKSLTALLQYLNLQRRLVTHHQSSQDLKERVELFNLHTF